MASDGPQNELEQPLSAPDGPERDFDIESTYFRVKTAHGVMRLGAGDEDFHEPEVTVMGDHREGDGPIMFVKTYDGALEEAKCHAEMTPEQARDLADRLETAADAYESEEPYHDK